MSRYVYLPLTQNLRGLDEEEEEEEKENTQELLPWTAGPGAKKNFDPEHPLAGDFKGCSLALLLYLIQFVSRPSSLALCISHPLPIPRGSPCLRTRVDVYECRGGKRSVISRVVHLGSRVGDSFASRGGFVFHRLWQLFALTALTSLPPLTSIAQI